MSALSTPLSEVNYSPQTDARYASSEHKPCQEYTSGLSRAVLMWVNSLDLKYKIKSARRSLSNGYIFGEILSKYYPSSVPLHGLEMGTSRRCKVTNFKGLMKCIKKHGIPLSDKLIEDTIDEVPGAAETALVRLHAHLTKTKQLEYRGCAGLGKVNSTPAATVLLDLEARPHKQHTLDEILIREAGDSDWIRVFISANEALKFFNRVIDAKEEILCACKHETKASILRFLRSLWTNFQEDVYSCLFQCTFNKAN